MNWFIILLVAMNRLDVGLSSSYITKIEKVVDIPIGVIFLKPTIEYGSRWGALIEDFYISLDCSDTRREIYVELGANCLRVGPFYRVHIGELEFTGSAGFLRIDVAALATGEFGGYSYAGQIDEESNGKFLGLKLKYTVADIIQLNPFFCVGMVEKGNFWEYGGGVAFMPFKKRGGPDFLKELAFTTGISIAQLGYVSEDTPYTLTFGYYLVGVSYEFKAPKKPEAEKPKLEERKLEKPQIESPEIEKSKVEETPEIEKEEPKPEEKEKHGEE